MRGTASWRAFVLKKGALGLAVITLAALAAACGDGQQLANPASPSAITDGNAASSSVLGVTTLASPSVLPAGNATKQSQGVPRHVTGVADGRFDFTNMWGPEWWQFYSDSDAKGTLSHLGLTRIHTRHVPNLVTGAVAQGEFTLVAANGDEIHGTYAGAATYDPDRADLLHGVATFVITGGTGRFLRATGSIEARFLETLDDPSWASAKVTWSFDGTVNY